MFCNEYLVFILTISMRERERERERELVALLELCSCCHVAVSVLCPWTFSRGAVVVCDCVISWSYSLSFC